MLLTALLLSSSDAPSPVDLSSSYRIYMNPAAWDQKLVRACGLLRRMTPKSHELLIETTGFDGNRSLLVSEDLYPAILKNVGKQVCIDGVVQRTDGLTNAEAVVAGVTYVMEDVPFDPAYQLGRSAKVTMPPTGGSRRK